MRNIIKYPPLEWRRRSDFCIPQGPSFAAAPRVTIPIAGSKVRFKAPRHSPRRSGVQQKYVLPDHDLLADPDLCSYGLGAMANDHWGYVTGLYRHWAFWGPWMTGCKAELSMSAAVLGRQPEFAFPEISLFHPKAFEMVMVRYLNDRYGFKNWEGQRAHIPRWHGPVDWQPHDHLPVFSASFKVYNRGDDVARLVHPDYLFVFPITDQHFVEINFRQRLSSLDQQGNIAFDVAPVQALQDAIFNSVTLELGAEAQASFDKVKAEHPDMQLTKDFPPLQWPTNANTPPAPEPTRAALDEASGRLSKP